MIMLVKPNELDKFYNYYIRSLKRSYEKLVEFYAFSLKLCWMQKNRNDYEKYLVLFPLTEWITNTNLCRMELHSRTQSQNMSLMTQNLGGITLERIIKKKRVKSLRSQRRYLTTPWVYCY